MNTLSQAVQTYDMAQANDRLNAQPDCKAHQPYVDAEMCSDRETKAHWHALQVRLRQCDKEAQALVDKLTVKQIQLIETNGALMDLWASGAADSVIFDALAAQESNIMADKADPVEPCVPTANSALLKR